MLYHIPVLYHILVLYNIPVQVLDSEIRNFKNLFLLLFFLKLSLLWDVSTLKCEFYLVWCFGGKVDTHKHAYIPTNCFQPDTDGQRGVTRWDPAHITPRVKLLYIYIYIYVQSFRSAISRLCLAKLPFLAWHEHKNERGIIDILKTFPLRYRFQIYIYIYIYRFVDIAI